MYRILACLTLGCLFVFTARAADEKNEIKPINLAKLNSDKDEDDPHVSSVGAMLLYTAVDAKGKGEIRASVRRSPKAEWLPGKAPPQLTGKSDHRGASLTQDGKFPQHLFFATNMDPETLNKGDNYDIYFYIKQFPDADFTTMTALRICTAADEMHPWVTADGRHVFFSRKTKDGWKVFVTSKPPAGGQFGPEKEVELPVNFHHATLSPDGKTMYLQGPVGTEDKERWGLFRSKATEKGWSKPEPLDGLNSDTGKIGSKSPALSRDGTILYFASDRDGGKGGLDIWAVPVAQLK
ncbi:MAG: TolB family protein [Gemmataceae bacterium]